MTKVLVNEGSNGGVPEKTDAPVGPGHRSVEVACGFEPQ